MKKLMMGLFLLALMGCGQPEEIPVEERRMLIAAMDGNPDGGGDGTGDKIYNDLPKEEDKPFRTDMDPSEMFTVLYWHTGGLITNGNPFTYGIYNGNNKIVEDNCTLELSPRTVTINIDHVKIPDGGEIDNSNKYDVYTVKHNEYYYFLELFTDNPNNGFDGDTFIYSLRDHSLNVPKGTWIATISIVEEGGDKNKPLQMYDIYS